MGLDLNEKNVPDAIQTTIEWLIKTGKGEASVHYKLRDWLFSRQRYWGEPIPVTHKEDGTISPLNESDLPLRLPEVEKYEPAETGESPLANIKKWVNTENGRRETNTMPQWAGSCWYFLRYIDPHNDKEPWSKEKEKYWMPVDLYIGGVEHAVLHLLYSRFWHHVLYDLGLVSTKEPFNKLFNQGMIRGEDGQKMSKSRGNVINPDDVVKDYGADSFRLYEMFMGPLDKSKPWSTKGLQGCYRFLQKVWRLFTENLNNFDSNTSDDQTLKLLHQTIKKITADLSNLRFNTSVSQLMILVNHLSKLKKLDKDVLETFLILLNPFSPHISEELYTILGNPENIASLAWPEWEESLVSSEIIILVVQFNGKRRGEIEIEKGLDKKDIFQKVITDNSFDKYFSEMEIIKEIYVENRLVNFVVKPI